MKIFVTGGAGYIGSVVVERLLERRHEVVVYDNLTKGHRESVGAPAILIEGDLADRSKLVASLTEYQSEAVIHLAASSLVGESISSPHLYFQNNIVNGHGIDGTLGKELAARIAERAVADLFLDLVDD